MSANLDRRRALAGLIGATAAAAFAPASAARTAAACADVATSFVDALASGTRPWTRALQGMAEDAAPMPMKLTGKLPSGLAGSLYRNGPARHGLGGVRYAHWFDGDGAVQQYLIGPRGVSHRARFVQTPKFLADSRAGRPVRHAYGTHVPGGAPVQSPDELNVANTNVLAHGGRLMALWEGGSAFEIDAATLGTRGAVSWSGKLAGVPFSAHPRIEPDGTMWNFGANFVNGLLVIYRIGADGRLAQQQVLRVPHLPMLHDFVVTEHHLVFLLPPFVFDIERVRAGGTLHDGFAWRPELGMRVMILEKSRLDAPPRWAELPPGFVFHFGNGCEDRGVIRLDCVRAASGWQVRHGMRELMCGHHEAQEHAHATLVEIDLAGGTQLRAHQHVLPITGEFPQVDPRTVGRRYRDVYVLASTSAASRPGYDTVVRYDVLGGGGDRYAYGDGVLVEEHVFVPAPGRAPGAGWLVGTALDPARGETMVSVFDARRLAAGPLAQARMPRLMPLAWHGSFVPA